MVFEQVKLGQKFVRLSDDFLPSAIVYQRITDKHPIRVAFANEEGMYRPMMEANVYAAHIQVFYLVRPDELVRLVE